MLIVYVKLNYFTKLQEKLYTVQEVLSLINNIQGLP